MSSASADRVFVNGRVHTLAAGRSDRASALAVWQGRILAIGDRDDVAGFVDGNTEIVDLGGAIVLPGFIETHMHPVMAGQAMSQPQIGTPPCTTIDEVIAEIARFASTVPHGQPIQPWGYDDTLIRDDRGLTRADLDRATGRHPVVVRHVSGHLTYVNSVVLDAAGITADTADPPGGAIIRDSNGIPTGELHEKAAWIIGSAVPRQPPTTTAAHWRRSTSGW